MGERKRTEKRRMGGGVDAGDRRRKERYLACLGADKQLEGGSGVSARAVCTVW